MKEKIRDMAGAADKVRELEEENNKFREAINLGEKERVEIKRYAQEILERAKKD